MYGTPIVAACAILSECGLPDSNSAGTTTYSAGDPSRIIPSAGQLPQTCSPFSRLPATTVPAKSRPGVRGRVVVLKRPATFPISLGLIAAAFTRTSVSPWPGSGIAISWIRNTDGGPNSANRSALIRLAFMAPLYRYLRMTPQRFAGSRDAHPRRGTDGCARECFRRGLYRMLVHSRNGRRGAFCRALSASFAESARLGRRQRPCTTSDRNHVRRSVWSIQTSISLAVATSLYLSQVSCAARK